jgi:hypothetical protein
MKRVALGVGLMAAAVALGCTPANGGSGGQASSSSSGGGSSGAPAGVVRAQTNGPLSGDGLAAAMHWYQYAPGLLDCLEPIAVDRMLDPNDPVDFDAIDAINMCWVFNRGGNLVANSVMLPSTADTFDVPVDTVPEPAVVSGGPNGAQLGIGAVLVFRDGNGNGVLDMVAPGTRESVDTVLGASLAVDEEDQTETLVIYRAGGVSPLWKLFVAIYGCPLEPPVGFSVVRLGFNSLDDSGCALAVDGRVDVELRNSEEMRSLICLPGGRSSTYRYPDAPLPADAVAECMGTETVFFTTTPDAVCPIVERYDLLGCTDLTSSLACRLTTWDLTESPPVWWPCVSFGPGPGLFLQPSPTEPTNGRDTLFTIQHRGGTWMRDVANLAVEIQTDDVGGVVVLSGDALVLLEQDTNGVFSTGDTLEVREREGLDSFNPTTPLGRYTVRVLDRAVTPARVVYEVLWTPRTIGGTIPEMAVFEAADDVASFTDGPDALFDLRYVSGVEKLSLDRLRVDIAYSCEAPYEFTGTDHLVLVDVDGDGKYGPGDTLRVGESDVLAPFGSYEVASFYHCIQVFAKYGPNWFEPLGYATWRGMELEVLDHADAVGDGADNLFNLAFVSGHERVDVSGAEVRVTGSFGETVATFVVGSPNAVLQDVDGDNRYGAGDVILVRETTPLEGFAARREDYLYVTLSLANGSYLGHGAWRDGER